MDFRFTKNSSATIKAELLLSDTAQDIQGKIIKFYYKSTLTGTATLLKTFTVPSGTAAYFYNCSFTPTEMNIAAGEYYLMSEIILSVNNDYKSLYRDNKLIIED